MEPIDIVILVGAVLAVGGVIARAIVLKKKGKSIGCDCSSCAGNCSCCKSREPNNESKQ